MKTNNRLTERIRELGIEKNKALEYAKKISFYFKKFSNLKDVEIELIDKEKVFSNESYKKELISYCYTKTNLKELMKKLNLNSYSLTSDLKTLFDLGFRFDFEIKKKLKNKIELTLRAKYHKVKGLYEFEIHYYRYPNYTFYVRLFTFTEYITRLLEILKKLHNFSEKDLLIYSIFLKVSE